MFFVQLTHGEWRVWSSSLLRDYNQPTLRTTEGINTDCAPLSAQSSRAAPLRTDQTSRRGETRVKGESSRKSESLISAQYPSLYFKICGKSKRDHVVGERSSVHEAAPHALSGAAGPPPHAAGQRVPLPQPGGCHQCVRD